MMPLDGRWVQRKPETSLRERIYRATYFLGITARHTVSLLRFPYQIIANKMQSRNAGPNGFRTGSRRKRINSRLSRMQSRLQSIEQSLAISDRSAGAHANHHYAGHGALHTDENTEGVPRELLEAMVDPDPGVRRFALTSIGEHAGEDITLLILDALNDPEPSVRCAAAAATAKANISSAVFSLILLLADSAPEVVQEAMAAIERITGRKVDFDPKAPAKTRQKKIEKLKNWWKKERFSRLSRDVKTATR